MIKFITLHTVDDNTCTRINIDNILIYHPNISNGTTIHILNKGFSFFKETPEEIDDLIEKAKK